MGKGGIGKKNRGPSIHSRAARRATSPGIDTDKSLKEVQPPPTSVNQRPAVLAAHHSGGVTKKTKPGRRSVLSSKARRRQEKGMDRAANVSDRTLQKVQRSKTQARSLDSRRRAWDEVNDEDKPRVSAKKAVKAREDELVRQFFAEGGAMDVEDDGGGTGSSGWDDAEDDEPGRDQQPAEVEVPTEGITNITLVDPASVPLPPLPMDDDDEIL
ncbi:hypothetical protein GQ53DRAFT_843212 [Thozetella sp. PMI_491]|nr:hypothetical protein GQ53DRAFT_843212 [Thozetella sp. PMI_491]